MATTPKKKAASAASAPAMPALPSLDDLSKLVERFKLPGVDVSALVEWQRKDLEALAQAQREAYEGVRALVERRSEILTETLAQWQEAMKDSTGKDALAKGSKAAQDGVQQAIANFRELAAMEAETRSKAWKVVQDRLQENMANLQKLLQPK